MDTVSKLTVYFEDPFWVGVFERMENGKLSVCKVTFGAEPKDDEVWEFVLKYYDRLVFSAAIASEMKKTADNPKRRRREAKKQIGQFTGIILIAQDFSREWVLFWQHLLEPIGTCPPYIAYAGVVKDPADEA